VKIGGWKTGSVFESYAIVSQTDIAETMRKTGGSTERA